MLECCTKLPQQLWTKIEEIHTTDLDFAACMMGPDEFGEDQVLLGIPAVQVQSVLFVGLVVGVIGIARLLYCVKIVLDHSSLLY